MQKKIIKLKKQFKLHAYGGIQLIDFRFDDPVFYARGALEFEKWNIGIQMNVAPTNVYELPSFYSTVRLEFKIF